MKDHVAILPILAILFLFLGSILCVVSIMRSSDWEYEVVVDAPPGVTWSVWIPAPAVETGNRFSGALTSMDGVDTPYGTLENVTGTGKVVLTFALKRTSFKAAALDRDAEECRVDLSGRNGLNEYWAWRSSSNPAFSITVNASVYCSIEGLSGSLYEGYGYNGKLETGWTSVEMQPGGGDCLLNDLWFPLFLISVALLCASIVVCVLWAFLATRNRRKERTENHSSKGPPQHQ